MYSHYTPLLSVLLAVPFPVLVNASPPFRVERQSKAIRTTTPKPCGGPHRSACPPAITSLPPLPDDLSICVDYFTCGQTYGGCYPITNPEPTWTVPTCVSTTTAASGLDDPEDNFPICVDFINSCGMMFGGCFPHNGPMPDFAEPPCPTDTNPPKYGGTRRIKAWPHATATATIDSLPTAAS